MNGRATLTVDAFREAMATLSPESIAKLDVLAEDESTRQVEVTTASSPQSPDRAVLGVYVSTYKQQLAFPVQLNMDSGEVIGPSSGLAWTLSVIDELTPGSMTAGRSAAVTGAIGPDGSVQAIGGLAQKAVAAERGGATVMLYPSTQSQDDVDRAKELTNGNLELIPVDSVESAVKALDLDGTVEQFRASHHP